jgi:glycosyltransferase involved in cell wall biosynthesis
MADPDNDGRGLTVVAEQGVMLGGMERIVDAVIERWPAAKLIVPQFLGERGESRFPAGEHVPLRGGREHFLAPLHWRRLERSVVLDAELVLALHSSGWALGPRAAPGVPVVAFTNGVPRWMGPSAQDYLNRRAWPMRVASQAALPLLRADQFRLLARADLVLACSREAAATLKVPVRVLNSPVDVDRFHGRGDPDGYVLAVGRLVRHKRFDLVVDAMQGRRDQLVIAGSGPELEHLRQRAPANVEFLGGVSDDELVKAFRGAKVLVHPAPEEFGIVMGEALAAGIPVIAPRAGGALEIVDSGRIGILLDSVTPETIGAALDAAPWNPEACHAAAARFATQHFIEKLADIFDEVLTGRPAHELPALVA